MDALIPGFYIWLGSFCWRLVGSDAEESYPGTIHSLAGISLVLPGYLRHRCAYFNGSLF
ncbi:MULTISPECIES: hypothetical protein [unclassified Microcystis]|uniref:hypothetical protein n=1 Tax=unclassified Microcystis TaxID=2643300 RepID=UPI0025850C15|nr:MULTISPECIES: hypothetical protein [unclassified Microcystis]